MQKLDWRQREVSVGQDAGMSLTMDCHRKS